MNLLYHVIATILSGRFIWAAAGAFVFVWLSITKGMEAKDVMFILGVIVGFLFRNQAPAKLEQ